MNTINIHQISTGFVDVPGMISLNIFVRGCKNYCSGCQNPNLQSFDPDWLFCISDLESYLTTYNMCECVCWLGGDATFQKDSLITFNKHIKKIGYPVILYTGQLFSTLDKEILKTT